MSLFDKLRATADRVADAGDGPLPFATVIDEVLNPTEVVIDGRRVLMCGSNNYFGLTFHPDVLAAAHRAIDDWGSATTGSRAANGSFAVHQQLERTFATLYGLPHARVFTTGYQANLALVAGLCGPDDVVVLDLESHASLFDGARLSGATIYGFRHNSPDSLQRKLAHVSDPTSCLVVIEGLYSFSGDIAPVAKLAEVCRSAGAYLLVDEAHSFGAYGPRGLGCAEDQGAIDAVDFIVGTFSKSLAGVGGFCVSRHDALEWLHFTARPYVFTASGSPANVAAAHAALDVLQRDPSLRLRLWDNIRRVRLGLHAAGFQLNQDESPIVSLQVGTAQTAILFWRALLEERVYVNVVLPPACRAEACLLRTSYSAAHTSEQLDRAVDRIVQIGRSLGVVPVPA